MLRLIFDNTPSIEARAKSAVRRVIQYQERIPDWPKEDLVWSRFVCYTCGETGWKPQAQSDECDACLKRREEHATVERELQELELEERRAELASKQRDGAGRVYA